MNLRDAIESINLYLEHGIDPGSFIEACLRSDLLEAYGRADPTSLEILPDIARHIHRNVPRAAIREGVSRWLADDDYRTTIYKTWRSYHAR